MADIRIKDLTTTASSTASDDFIAVDGTTNGTRKLNAFSPTFGGNATVTGTLTVNSTSPSVFSGTVQANAFHVPGNGASKPANTDSYLAATATTSIPLYVSGFTGGGQSADILRVSLNSSSDWFAVKGNGQVTCLATTASTTTSTGALVVSGGVGIAKQIVAGEDITIDPIDASPENLAPEVAFCRSASLATATSVLAFGSSSRIGLLRGYHDGADQVEWRFGSYIGTTFNEQMRLGGTSATSSSLTLYGTTASTSTSSGALVVSGGVGIAGNAYVGGKLVVSGGVENTISGNVEFSTGQIRVTNAYTPLSASAAGAVGSITWDNIYIYVCVATNTWKRVAISSW